MMGRRQGRAGSCRGGGGVCAGEAPASAGI